LSDFFAAFLAQLEKEKRLEKNSGWHQEAAGTKERL
jgi:hypothetical protein